MMTSAWLTCIGGRSRLMPPAAPPALQVGKDPELTLKTAFVLVTSVVGIHSAASTFFAICFPLFWYLKRTDVLFSHFQIPLVLEWCLEVSDFCNSGAIIISLVCRVSFSISLCENLGEVYMPTLRVHSEHLAGFCLEIFISSSLAEVTDLAGPFWLLVFLNCK